MTPRHEIAALSSLLNLAHMQHKRSQSLPWHSPTKMCHLWWIGEVYKYVWWMERHLLSSERTFTSPGPWPLNVEFYMFCVTYFLCSYFRVQVSFFTYRFWKTNRVFRLLDAKPCRIIRSFRKKNAFLNPKRARSDEQSESGHVHEHQKLQVRAKPSRKTYLYQNYFFNQFQSKIILFFTKSNLHHPALNRGLP